MLSPHNTRNFAGHTLQPQQQHIASAHSVNGGGTPTVRRHSPTSGASVASPPPAHASGSGLIPPQKIRELIGLLREIRAHAAATEQQLWELDYGIKETMRKTDMYWNTIVAKRGTAFATSLKASMYGDRRGVDMDTSSAAANEGINRASAMGSNDGAGSSSSSGAPSSSTTDMDSIVAAQNTTLRHRLAGMMDEMRQDQESKIRLLQAVEYHLYGAPRATLADRSLLGAGGQGQVPAVLQSLATVVKRLPEGNVDVLKRSRFFEFALASVRSAIRMHQRDGVVNTENAILTGCQHSGFPAKLVRAMSSITAEDLQML